MNHPFDLPPRPAKPRSTGITCLIDSGVPTGYFEDVLASHGDLVDGVKFGWGTALVTRDIGRKIAAARKAGCHFFFGGSLFEKAVQQGKVDAFEALCEEMGCPMVEISDGTLEIDGGDKCRYIERFARKFEVWSEVGYKDPERSINFPPFRWIEQMRRELDAGARRVITEARETGTSGICRADGEIRYGLIEEMLQCGIPVDSIVFEAPNKGMQTFFIRKLGPSVNLSNIAMSDVVGVETLRLGLRSDTMVSKK